MLYKRKERPEGSYDTIVIGSGLAGMTAAKKLGLNGRKVLLLESHNKLGGFATWFRRKQGEHIFDVSLHGFPIGMKKTCRKYWTKNIADSIKQVNKVRFINPQYDLTSDFTKEDFTEKLVNHFNVPRDTVEGFFNHLASMNFYDDDGMTNGELFKKYFGERNDITRFLLEPIVYANGSTLEDPAISYGIVFSNFMSKGVYIYRGGTDKLISEMKENLLETGVDIKLHAFVEEIVVENGVTRGVKLSDGHFIESKSVVSNANLHKTIFKMVGKQKWAPEYVESAQKVRLNTSSCQVFMGLKPGTSIPDMGELIFYSEDKEFSTDALLSPKVGSQTFSLYYPNTRPSKIGDNRGERFAVVSSSNARYEDWANLTETEYKDKKEYNIERALSCLDKIIPGTREKINYVDASTPLTVEKYTHHKGGASFGTKFEGLPVSMNMHKEISGLFHAGSVGIIMSGWLGAANYGVIQSHEVDNYLDKIEEKDHLKSSQQTV